MKILSIPYFQLSVSPPVPSLRNSDRQPDRVFDILPFLRNIGSIVLAGILVVVFIDSALSQSIITNLASPQSIVTDGGQGYFISNANGDWGNHEPNGFITKLDQQGNVTALHFIQGGKGEVILHSPAGMAIVKNILFVADLDTVRGFDKKTGRPVISISLAKHEASSLTGLTANSKGILFVSDQETNSIYRIDPHQEHAVSLHVQDPAFSHPRGLAIHPRRGHLVGVGWEDGKIFEVEADGTVNELRANSFFSSRFYNLDGIDFDRYGNMYVSDFTAGKIWRLRPDDKKEVIAEFLISPAGISVDRENHLILVPYFYANGVEINGLERPVNATTKRKKRTLSDYGLRFLEKDESQ